MIVRRVLACLAGVLLVLVAGGAPALAATPSTVQAGLFLAQPGSVCGYSDHALARMSTRGITPLDVRTAVALGGDTAFRNAHGNWQYESGGLIVVMNDAGCVVTAFRR